MIFFFQKIKIILIFILIRKTFTKDENQLNSKKIKRKSIKESFVILSKNNTRIDLRIRKLTQFAIKENVNLNCLEI